MKMKKIWTRSIAGILSFLMGLMMFNMPVYADDYDFGKSNAAVITENNEMTALSGAMYRQDTGWYKEELGKGSVAFDKFVLDQIIKALTAAAPGIIGDAVEDLANYIYENEIKSSYYIKYLNSQVVDKCTQRYYYSYDWYTDPECTNYVGTTQTQPQLINLCRR